MNTGEGSRQNWLILLAVAGVLVAAFDLRRFGALLLLWIPLPFYAYSIAYGSVPIFVPEWWPFSYYNVRYGLELLPAIAVFVAVIPWAISRLHRRWLTIGRNRCSLRCGFTCLQLLGVVLFPALAGSQLGAQVDDSHLLSRSLGEQPQPSAT